MSGREFARDHGGSDGEYGGGYLHRFSNADQREQRKSFLPRHKLKNYAQLGPHPKKDKQNLVGKSGRDVP